MDRVELGDHHRSADELGARDLLVLGEYVHHVGGDLVALVPQHGIDVEVDRRIGADGRHRIAYGLEIGTENAHIAETLHQAVNRVGRVGERIDRVGRNPHRQRVGGQRIGHLQQQRIHLPVVAGDQRVDLAQGRGIDRNHLAFAGGASLTGAEFRLGLEFARSETPLLPLLLGQQFGRRLILAFLGDLLQFFLPGLGRSGFLGRLQLGGLLLEVGFPGIADQRVERIDGRNGQRIRDGNAQQRIGNLPPGQRIRPCGVFRRTGTDGRNAGTSERIRRRTAFGKLPGRVVRRPEKGEIGFQTRQRIGFGRSGGPAQCVFIDREEVHRIGAHEKRVALRKVVTHHRGPAREERISRLLPVLAVVAEGDHLVFGVVQLQITPQDHMVLGAVVMEAVAPDLLLFGQDIAVARHDVERIGLVVGTAVGIEVVAVLVPDVGAVEEKGVVGSHVVNHRIALEFVFVVAHFDAVDGDQLNRNL